MVKSRISKFYFCNLAFQLLFSAWHNQLYHKKLVLRSQQWTQHLISLFLVSFNLVTAAVVTNV